MRQVASSFLISLALWLPFFQGGQATVIRHGSAFPATCSDNQDFFIKDADGPYFCHPANTWVAVGGGTGSGVTNVSTTLPIVGGPITSAGIISMANQGTTTTVLHGNAAGNPAFSSVSSADLNITSTTCTNQVITAISIGGVGTCSSVSNAMLVSSSITVTGTSNQVNVSGSPVSLGGTVTLSTPQNIHTGATPQFARIGLGDVADATAVIYGKGGNRTPIIWKSNDGSPAIGFLYGDTTSTGIKSDVGNFSGSSDAVLVDTGHTASIYTNGSERLKADSNGVVIVKTTVAVGSLPTCNAGTSGGRLIVNNANSTTFNAVVAGGGANIIPVFCDGTNWRID